MREGKYIGPIVRKTSSELCVFLFCFDGTVNDSKLMDVGSHYWWFLGRVRKGVLF